MDCEIKKALESQIDTCNWKLIEPHANRGVVFVVDQAIDLIEVASAIIKDETDKVSQWIDSATIARPSELQVHNWEKIPDKQFQIIVAKPYVLIKEVIHA